MDTYDFCEENLSDYEKTMLRLAISFGRVDLYILEDSDIQNLSNLLKIDYHKLERALLLSDRDVNPFTVLKFGDKTYEGELFHDYELFDVIVRCYYIFKALNQISELSDKEHLKNNILLFDGILHNFEIINAKSATYECMYHNRFSLDFAIYSNSGFTPKDSIHLLKLFLSASEYYEQNKDILPVIYQLLNYELYTRTNTLYLISLVQIIKHSPFYDKSIRDIADDFYSHLLFMLRNARVISIQVNSLRQTAFKKPEQRTKKDNTTRLQVLYGYDNYDTYALRLDLAHQGEGFVHYNNRSPGGIKCCLFNESEYQEIIEKYPKLNKCFIQYGNRRALKELKNCDVTIEEKPLYEIVRKSKEHDSVFGKTYSEENIVSFIELFANMLPSHCYVPIDKEEIHAKYCFNYDKIMGGVFCLYLAYFSCDEKETTRVLDFIISRAVNYELISESDSDAYSCIDGLCIIIECARGRIFGLE